ncbi:MAG TPA: hypothetical protein VME43_07435 [Bryobacteraceae bacterium]|nr:hypothetical protein [Bryobacteraceae bacterium]
MTITLDISAEVQVELARQADAHGLAVEAYAAYLIEEAVHPPASANPIGRKPLEETLREMAEWSHKIPALPDEAFTRGNLYRNHD